MAQPLHLCGTTLDVTTVGPCRVARLADEPYADIDGIEDLIGAIDGGVDLFTFRQRLPDVTPHHRTYAWKPDPVAALPITTTAAWRSTIGSTGRNMLKKSRTAGVVIRETPFDDTFLNGMHAIFNETPLRQGMPFWHYGKPIAQLRQEFSRHLSRETILGAYLAAQLIGFLFLADNGTALQVGQIVSLKAQRHTAPNNRLLEAAVDVCVTRGVPYLAYAEWSAGTLGAFKRHNGFQRYDLPRYYVPLTTRGRLALTLGLHRGLRGWVPDPLRTHLVALRKRYFPRFATPQHS